MSSQSRKSAHDDEQDPNFPWGYGRPPVRSRFRPGQSGNPKGRPKRESNIKILATKILNEPVRMREGERTRTVSSAEALLRKMASDALHGDAKARAALLGLVRDLGLFGDHTDPSTDEIKVPDEAGLLSDYVKRHAPAVDNARKPRRRRRKGRRR